MLVQNGDVGLGRSLCRPMGWGHRRLQGRGEEPTPSDRGPWGAVWRGGQTTPVSCDCRGTCCDQAAADGPGGGLQGTARTEKYWAEMSLTRC